MIKGLSEAGLANVENVEELINLASENGFGAIDTSGSALRNFVAEKGLSEAKAFLKKKRVIIGSMAFPVEWRQTDEEFRDGLELLLADAKTAAQFGCHTFFTYFMPSTDNNVVEHLMILTKRIRTSARLLKEYDINLALEFVGPHHLRNKWENIFIWNIKSTIEWLDIIGEDNVGIVLDSIHWYTSEGTLEDIISLKPHQIAYVHLNDAKDGPVEEVLDNDRLYPGEGVIDLNGFLRCLKEINYTGVVSQEILSIEEPTETNEVLAGRSRKAFTKVFTEAGLE
ncbi:sugar phosphate isomerase/epimerase family protein [Lederbergia lenta]|uniref:Xylose isomerase n=1 Tax=Lederbergia lenta TaxID=1467 RepID=A0A2X4WGT3_LEDLE|nr:sugar phosphate isomerase/epimerase family protein [Lederbergia lenta]MEC2322924.1 sugar phosphate isomerase/epimerase [Lederbergia lenta]SQI62049.1 xylose isomerase [Lederbergia lenta]